MAFRSKLRRPLDPLFRETQFATPRPASLLYVAEAQVALVKAFWKVCSMLILLKGIVKGFMVFMKLLPSSKGKNQQQHPRTNKYPVGKRTWCFRNLSPPNRMGG